MDECVNWKRSLRLKGAWMNWRQRFAMACLWEEERREDLRDAWCRSHVELPNDCVFMCMCECMQREKLIEEMDANDTELVGIKVFSKHLRMVLFTCVCVGNRWSLTKRKKKLWNSRKA